MQYSNVTSPLKYANFICKCQHISFKQIHRLYEQHYSIDNAICIKMHLLPLLWILILKMQLPPSGMVSQPKTQKHKATVAEAA